MRRSSFGSDRPGYSLIELVVYCALLIFLMGCVSMLVMAGVRYFQTDAAYQTAQQQAGTAVRRMTRELSNGTTMRSVVAADHIIFLSPEAPLGVPGPWTHDGAGHLYHKWVCFYHDAPSRELRRVEDSAGFTAPQGDPAGTAPPPPGITALRGRPDRLVIARDVTFFRIDPGDTAEMLQLSVYAQEETGGSTNTQKRFTEIRVRTQVDLPNK
ncbi:MAG: hypothetical protein HY319_24915 [Armatimonadetes bacterium]|nr:hypothetical protein [Armatimonadota bacterium]